MNETARGPFSCPGAFTNRDQMRIVMNKQCRGLLGDTIYQISKLYAFTVTEEKIFKLLTSLFMYAHVVTSQHSVPEY